MSFGEKIDALDFVINCLKDHEKELDSLIFRFETALKKGGM